MRAPHHIPTHPHANPDANPQVNPYDELGALDDGPLEGALQRGSERDSEGNPEWGPDSEQGFERGPEEDEPSAPPNHGRSGTSRRRKRGRCAGLPFALKAVCGLVVLAAFHSRRPLGPAATPRAGRRTRSRTGWKLSAAPEVEIGGFPFLTQVADKRLDSVRLTVPDVAADRISLARVTATAHDVHLNADGLTAIRGADIPRFDGEVLFLRLSEPRTRCVPGEVHRAGPGPGAGARHLAGGRALSAAAGRCQPAAGRRTGHRHRDRRNAPGHRGPGDCTAREPRPPRASI
ncbi:hypothetical protein SALBM311S_10647 [Streptomyces alboniger]